MAGKAGTAFDPDVVDAFLRVADRKIGTSLTGNYWSMTPQHPENPLPWNAEAAT